MTTVLKARRSKNDLRNVQEPTWVGKPKWILEVFPGVTNVKPVFYWRLRSYRNKKIVCTGNEPFPSVSNARRAFMALPFPPGSFIVKDYED